MALDDPRSSPISRRAFLGVGASLAATVAVPTTRGWPLLPQLMSGAVRRPGSRPFQSRPAGQPQPDLAPELAGIDHIIVVMMENHSFDNYLGMLPYRVPSRQGSVDGWRHLGGNGVPTVTQTTAAGLEYRAFPMPNACQASGAVGPSQSWTASHEAFAGGAMNGFLLGSGEAAMGYWDDRLLPFYYSLAGTFPVCDRWFCSTLCQTYPNRVFLMAGTAAGLTSTDTPPPTVTPPNGKIFDVLDSYGITWADWYTNLPTPGLFGAAYVAARQGRNFFGPFAGVDATIAAFKASCMAGTLPSFVMVESDYQYGSEENPQDIQVGQYFVAGVVNALFSVPSVWAKSLLVLVYDEHGGYYDHVPPPPALSPGDGTHPNLPQSQWFGDDYTRLGFRVPAVIVSPFARPNHVSHTVFDHTSVLKTIERKWNLPALTYRDANANHLGDMLTTDGSQPFAVPPALAAAPLATQANSVYCATTPDSYGTFPKPRL